MTVSSRRLTKAPSIDPLLFQFEILPVYPAFCCSELANLGADISAASNIGGSVDSPFDTAVHDVRILAHR